MFISFVLFLSNVPTVCLIMFKIVSISISQYVVLVSLLFVKITSQIAKHAIYLPTRVHRQ